jgi:hypothetical protein
MTKEARPFRPFQILKPFTTKKRRGHKSGDDGKQFLIALNLSLLPFQLFPEFYLFVLSDAT